MHARLFFETNRERSIQKASANAVCNPTDLRVMELPIYPHKSVEALKKPR